MRKSEDIDIVRRASPASGTKRFLSSTIDAFLILLVGYLIFFSFYNRTKNRSVYESSSETVKEEISYYNDMIEETHLVSFYDKTTSTRYESDIFAVENIYKLLLRSDEVDPRFDKQNSDGSYRFHEVINSSGEKKECSSLLEAVEFLVEGGEGDESKEYRAASYSEDDIAYFYTVYVPANNEDDDILNFGIYSPEEYFYKTFYDTLGSTMMSILFDYDTDAFPSLDSYPLTILSDRAIGIFEYYFQSVINDTTKNYFDKLVTCYETLQENAEKLVVKSKTYYNTRYATYHNARNTQGLLIFLDMVIGIFLAYILVFLLPQFIYGNGVSFGKRIVKLRYIAKDGEFLYIGKLIAADILFFFTFLPLIFIYPVFPPLYSNYDSLFSTIFSIGSFDLTVVLFLLIVSAISLISSLTILFTHYKTSLLDICIGDYVVDLTRLDEPDYDERNEGSL